jgi:arginase family enzyme
MFIVKIPGINGENTRGCERAGNAILKYLKKIHTNEKGIPIESESLDIEEIHIDNSNLKLTNKLIYENALEIFETKPKTVFLGGDGSVSYSTLRAFSAYCNKQRKKPCLIVFDAHADVNTTRKEEPGNREWLYRLIEDGFPASDVLIVGARNISKEELVFLRKKSIKVIDMNQLLEDLHETCDFIMEFSNGKELYLSVDIDAVDPVFAPATESPEPGGLSGRQIIYLVQRINKIKTLKAADMTEINSEKDNNELTVGLGAKILAELM